jgi:LmbE family N-acetylglucosaminyl deacetylase
MKSSQIVMVIVAHPDDEVLGCGGTMARLSQEGHDVYILILGEGITSRLNRREDTKKMLVESLHADSRHVADLLKAKDIFQYNLPDNRFDTVPLLELIKIIEKQINRLQPHTIYTHYSGDLNIDHLITHRAVLTATRPLVNCTVKELYSFEVPSSTDWAFGQFQQSFRPNVFIDISNTLKIKVSAMELYQNEIRNFPHPRSSKAIRATAFHWGSIVGYKAAEVFESVRIIR